MIAARYRMYRRNGHGRFVSATMAPPPEVFWIPVAIILAIGVLKYGLA